MEIWEESDIVFDGKVVRLRVGKVRLDDGSPAYREVIEHPGGACVLPCTGDAFVLIQQYRIALAEYLIEAPAGKLERGETPEQCALKELREETGYEAGRLIALGRVYSSVGFCNEVIHLFLALDLKEVGRCLEPEERMESLVVPLDSARRGLREAAYSDGKTAVLLQRALHWLDGEAANAPAASI